MLRVQPPTVLVLSACACLGIASTLGACQREQPHLRASRSAETSAAPASTPAPTPAPAPTSVTGEPPSAPAWGGLTVIERGDPSADAAFVLLHGYGAPGDDLAALGDALAARAGRPLRVIVPAAPIAMSHGGRAWYALDGGDPAAQTRRSREALEGVLATLAARGVPSRRVVVGGFSQGALLSIEVAIAAEQPIAGIAVLSGRALEHPPADFERLRGLPIFQAHGRADARIAFALGERFRDDATRAGAQVEFLPFEGGHSIPGEVESALAAWLGRTLD